jgi:hypothetical protein
VNATVSGGVGRYDRLDAVQEFRFFFMANCFFFLFFFFFAAVVQILAGRRPRARDKIADGSVRRRNKVSGTTRITTAASSGFFCANRVFFEHFVYEQGFGTVAAPRGQGHFDGRRCAPSSGAWGRRRSWESCPVDLGGLRQVRTIVVFGRGAQLFDTSKDRLVVGEMKCAHKGREDAPDPRWCRVARAVSEVGRCPRVRVVVEQRRVLVAVHNALAKRVQTGRRGTHDVGNPLLLVIASRPVPRL